MIGSRARGFFVIAYTHYHDVVHYGIASYRSVDRSAARVSLELDLPGQTNFSFFVFDLNERGLPFPVSANVVQTVSVTAPTTGQDNEKGIYTAVLF